MRKSFPIVSQESHGYKTHVSAERSTSTNGFPKITPALVLGMMAGYFLLQLVLRVWVSDSLQLDEAEMIVLTQEWRWGYDSQPPLYTWLQKLVFYVTGENVLGLAVLKNLLLLAIYVMTWLSAREVLRQNHLALLAAASLAFIPTIVYECQRDRTHVIVAALCSTATLFAFLRLLKTGKLVWYVILGALAGAGLLSKYSYVVFPITLLLSAVTLKLTRSVVLNWKMLLSLVSFVVVTGPHGVWAWNHPDLFLRQSYKFHMESDGGVSTALTGIGQLLFEAGQFAVPSILIYLVVLAGSSPLSAAKREGQLSGRIVERALLFGVVICLATVIGFQVTQVKARWLLPILVTLPVVLVFRAQHRLTDRRIRALFIMALLVAAGMLARPIAFRASLLEQRGLLSVPFDALANEIRRTGFDGGMIVAESKWLGGNLRLKFKNSMVVTDAMSYLEPRKNVPILITWNATNDKQPDEGFLNYAEGFAGQKLRIEDATFVSALRKHGRSNATRLGIFLVFPTQSARRIVL